MAINSSAITKTSYQDPTFLTNVEDFLNFALENNDRKAAYNLSRVISKFLAQKKNELEQSPDTLDFYRKVLVKAEFFALPLLENNEVIDLLKNHFISQFEIDFYNLLGEFRAKLLSLPVYEDRDALRKEIGKILLDSPQLLTGGAMPPRTIGEWIKDYSAKLGIGRVDSLKRSQYFIDLGRDKKLNDKDRGKLKVLFDLYEETKLSTLDAFGFDDEVPVIVQDQYYNYQRGVLQKLEGDKNELARIDALLKNKAENVPEEKTTPPAVKSPVTPAATSTISPAASKELADLQQRAAKYPAGSLQRKAVEAEIRKLSKKI